MIRSMRAINCSWPPAAQLTSTIRLCSLVHLLPFYHPLRLARRSACWTT